jgi:predicted amidohydrolase YtcJ
VYFGGDIITMVGSAPQYVEAVVVRDGKITFVGQYESAIKEAGAGTRQVNLSGKTLLPGFIDTHGHFILTGKNLVDADLFNTKDISELLARMRSHSNKVPEGGWIVGFGYQARAMTEKRAPTLEELDSISQERPVMVVDSSGHLGSMNSAAYRAAGISAETPDPVGGAFARKADGKSLAGPAEETALNAVREKRPEFTGTLADSVATGAAELWAQYGQTTAMECGLGLGSDDITLVRNAIDKRLLNIDLYICAKDSATDATIEAARKVRTSYAKADIGSIKANQDRLVEQANSSKVDSAKLLLQQRPDLDRRYVNRVRLGGIKFWLDGSIDTAWFTQPYTTNPPGRQGAFYGYQQIPNEVLDAAFDKYWKSELQINMHMNGDAAADQAIRAIERAISKHGMYDHRPVFVHGSSLRNDQIAVLGRIGAIPSFLTSSLVPGGDGVVKLWGAERAARAMPAATLQAKGLPFTLSHDAPISPRPWILPLVDAAVNRISKSGLLIGPAERITPYDALRAVTATAAYQIKEEKTKGTLEVGKLADLVILEENPLKVNSKMIKDIRVIQTIKEGTPLFTLERAREQALQAAFSSHPCVHNDLGVKRLSAEARDTLGILLAANEG